MDEGFHTTRWTRVIAARGGAPESKAALSELCEIYYGPVFRYIRNAAGVGEDAAQDLTHAFFEGLLGKGGIGNVEQGRAKFRSYLLGAVKHFLADQRKRDSAAKRGGGVPDEEFDEVDDEGGSSAPVRDSYFDREWALALLGRAHGRLLEEHEAQGKGEQFEALKPWLTGDQPGVSQAEVASGLGVSEGALKVAIHRLRKRMRGAVRAEISHTAESEDEIAGELNYLIEALG